MPARAPGQWLSHVGLWADENTDARGRRGGEYGDGHGPKDELRTEASLKIQAMFGTYASRKALMNDEAFVAGLIPTYRGMLILN